MGGIECCWWEIEPGHGAPLYSSHGQPASAGLGVPTGWSALRVWGTDSDVVNLGKAWWQERILCKYMMS